MFLRALHFSVRTHALVVLNFVNLVSYRVNDYHDQHDLK